MLRFNSDWEGYSDDFANRQSTDVTAAAEPMDDLSASAALAIGSYSLLIYSKNP